MPIPERYVNIAACSGMRVLRKRAASGSVKAIDSLDIFHLTFSNTKFP